MKWKFGSLEEGRTKKTAGVNFLSWSFTQELKYWSWALGFYPPRASAKICCDRMWQEFTYICTQLWQKTAKLQSCQIDVTIMKFCKHDTDSAVKLPLLFYLGGKGREGGGYEGGWGVLLS